MDQMFRIVGFHRHLTIKVGIRFIFLPELLLKQEKTVLKTMLYYVDFLCKSST